MVKISGNFGKVKSWINRLIRTKATGNLFVGEDAGLVTSGDCNTFIGYLAGYYNTSGHSNDFVGYLAGYYNTSGYSNDFVGRQTGYYNTTGHSNNFVGYLAGYYNTTGHSNNFVGYQAGYTNITGHSNNFVGYQAGYTNITGVQNVFLGLKAGYFETASNTLFIDNAPRTNEADARVKALIYGLFEAATANQLLRVNGVLQLTEIKNGSDQANAGAAANEVWKTNGHASLPDNVLMIGV